MYIVHCGIVDVMDFHMYDAYGLFTCVGLVALEFSHV